MLRMEYSDSTEHNFILIFCNENIPVIEFLVLLLWTQLEILYGSN